MAPHSSILAWKIPWTEEPGGLQSMGSQRFRSCVCEPHTHIHTHIHPTWTPKSNTGMLPSPPQTLRPSSFPEIPIPSLNPGPLSLQGHCSHRSDFVPSFSRPRHRAWGGKGRLNFSTPTPEAPAVHSSSQWS